MHKFRQTFFLQITNVYTFSISLHRFAIRSSVFDVLPSTFYSDIHRHNQRQVQVLYRIEMFIKPSVGILVKDTLVMDIMVTDISVTGRFGNMTFW